MRVPVTCVFILLVGGCGDDAPSGASQLEARTPQTAELVSPQQAIAGAFVPQLDPHTMNDAEITTALPRGYRCVFRYTSTGKPVIAIGFDATAALKLNGKLTVLPARGAPRGAGDAAVYASDGVRIAIATDGEPIARVRERHDAVLQFVVGSMLRVGYRGYYECEAP